MALHGLSDEPIYHKRDYDTYDTCYGYLNRQTKGQDDESQIKHDR